MALDLPALLDELMSMPATLGVFETMTLHEPKSAPGHGVTFAMWVQGIGPASGSSGLASTTVLLEFNVRIYTNMIAEPQDDIDPTVLQAVSDLMAVYSEGFTLGGQAREIDLLGQFGPGLSAKAGYIGQDSKMYRVMTVTVPVIIDDAYEQVA